MSGGPRDFVPRSVEDWVESHAKGGANVRELRRDALASIRRKKAGAKCDCGDPIWAMVDALAGCGMCFSCTTGEADASSDYEFTEVCW